jgi:sugar phosphate isomerase/epimerase
VHVKDVTLQGEHRLFGEGDMYYSAVWQGLAEIGYDGALGLECHVKPCDELPVEKIVEHEIRQVRASLATSPLGGRLAEQSD